MNIPITMAKVRSFIPLARDWLAKWWIALATFVIGLLVVSHYYTLVYNATDSLPMKFFIVQKQERSLKRGDFVAFPWPRDIVYPKGIGFIKQVAGLPGDRVVVDGDREFKVLRATSAADGIPGATAEAAELRVGKAKTHGERGSMRGVPLELGFTGVIPEGYIYVYAWSKDSLDSRYALLGLVKIDSVIGKAKPVL